MKRFIQYVALLTFFFTIFLAFLLVDYSYCIDRQKSVVRRRNYSGEKIIFLGSSHARDAFKNGVIEDSYNLASSGFSLEESYKELVRVLSLNNNLRTVVVSMSPFSLRKTNKLPDVTNVVFDLRESYGNNIVKNYFCNPSRKEFMFYIPNTKELQHYRPQLDSIKLRGAARAEAYDHTLHTDHFYGLEYFLLINKLCKKSHIQLIYVVTPFSNVYNGYVANDKHWKEDLIYLKSHAKDYEFYDFSKYFSYEKEDVVNFCNGSHLNRNGALAFTKFFDVTVLKSNCCQK